MVYFVALVLSLLLFVQVVASESVSGNIGHLEQGREPNAGVAIFPIIPSAQFLLLGIAWLLEKFLPNQYLSTLVFLHVLFSNFWLADYRKSLSKLKHLKEIHKKVSV